MGQKRRGMQQVNNTVQIVNESQNNNTFDTKK